MEGNTYQKKFVAFVDILGFKGLVKSIESKSKTHETDFRKVESVLNYLNGESLESNGQHDLPVYEEAKGGLIARELGNPNITYISDCAVITTDGNFGGFKSLCNKITKFSTDIACDGLFLRGAIVYGDVYHNGRILFGSAYQQAYDLEMNKSIYPRIIIDESVYKSLETYIGNFPLNEAGILKDPVDNLQYLRLFPFGYHPMYIPSWLDFLLRIKSHILYHLNKFDTSVSGFPKDLRILDQFCMWKESYTWNLDFSGGDVKILNKYLWIKDEFNRTLKEYSAYLEKEDGSKRISPIIKKGDHWGPQEMLGHLR